MKYKIYHGGTQYRFPRTNTKITGYGDLIPVRKDGYVTQIPMLNGDTLYISRQVSDDGNDTPALVFDSEGGWWYSIFYNSISNQAVQQSSHGWLCTDMLMQTTGDSIRVYYFGEDAAYDGYDEIADEQYCKNHGTNVLTLKVVLDEEGKEHFRVVNPDNLRYNGQTIDLPSMQTTLFISGFAQVAYGEAGFFCAFDDGSGGVGFVFDNGECMCQSSSSWFGSCSPMEDWQLHIFHIGYLNLYEYLKEVSGFDSVPDWANDVGLPQPVTFRDYYELCRADLGEPIILTFTGSRWELDQEGTRNDG